MINALSLYIVPKNIKTHMLTLTRGGGGGGEKKGRGKE